MYQLKYSRSFDALVMNFYSWHACTIFVASGFKYISSHSYFCNKKIKFKAYYGTEKTTDPTWRFSGTALLTFSMLSPLTEASFR